VKAAGQAEAGAFRALALLNLKKKAVSSAAEGRSYAVLGDRSQRSQRACQRRMRRASKLQALSGTADHQQHEEDAATAHS